MVSERQQARVLKEHRFESGTLLKRGQNVVIETVIPGNQFVGVRWRDKNGTHVAAFPLEDLETFGG